MSRSYEVSKEGRMRREYTLAEVAAAVGMSERNVRAYRSRGLIAPPAMRGRVGYYGQQHLAQLRLVQSLLGRGLGLSVITQLVRRGVTHTELARMVRDELPAGETVQLSGETFAELELAEPGLVQRLADLGLGHRVSDGSYRSDPTLFALSNLLVSLGCSPLNVARVSELAAICAEELVERLPRLAPQGGIEPDSADQIDASVVELACTAFRLALSARLTPREP